MDFSKGTKKRLSVKHAKAFKELSNRFLEMKPAGRLEYLKNIDDKEFQMIQESVLMLGK